MKVNFVLIDYENVQSLKLEKLHGLSGVEIRVFLGSHQCKVPLELAVGLQPFGEKAQYIQLAINGKNALDFFLSFYLGQLDVLHPGASFHVISKDTGYDPLIAQLRTKNISCQRWEKIEQIPILKVASALPNESPDKVAAARKFLAKPKTGKPTKLVKLRTHLKHHFTGVSEKELDAIVNGLEKDRFLTVGTEGKLTYHDA